MKTHKILLTALVAALFFAGCQKDNKTNRVLKIFAEDMTAAGDSKFIINPDSYAALWQAGDQIRINDKMLTIQHNTEGYSVSIEGNAEPTSVGGYYYGMFPGESFDGNGVRLNYTDPTAPVLILDSLNVRFTDDGCSVIFPMGAKAHEDDDEIDFKHLTAGFRLALVANTTPVEVTKLKVYVYGSTATPGGNVTVNEVTYNVSWANEGIMPVVPIGQVGSITDQDLRYGSEMIFNMQTGYSTGVEFNATAKKFCIPITLGVVKRITVIGYNGSDLVFSKTSSIASPVALQRGMMYPIKEIVIN